jgi:hypothetical protein
MRRFLLISVVFSFRQGLATLAGDVEARCKLAYKGVLRTHSLEDVALDVLGLT